MKLYKKEHVAPLEEAKKVAPLLLGTFAVMKQAHDKNMPRTIAAILVAENAASVVYAGRAINNLREVPYTFEDAVFAIGQVAAASIYQLSDSLNDSQSANAVKLTAHAVSFAVAYMGIRSLGTRADGSRLNETPIDTSFPRCLPSIEPRQPHSVLDAA